MFVSSLLRRVLVGCCIIGGYTASASLFTEHPWLPPATYYANAQGFLGTQLDSRLNSIIRGHTVIAYSNLPLVFRVTDVDPEIPGNLILIYSGQSMPASQLGSAGNNVWNREHVWPRSWGVGDNGADFSDAHHLFPCNATVNSTRSNLNFDWTDPWDVRQIPLAPGSTFNSRSFEPRDEDKGIAARAIIYMATRYDGTETNTVNLRLGNRPNQAQFIFGWLDALLAWNRMFPPNDFELRRNHLIFDGVVVDGRFFRQNNRNPFIDFPELADAIYLPVNETRTFGNWRWQHFTIQQLWDANFSGDHADPDGDGIPNLMELAINGNPTTATERLPMTWQRAQDGSVTVQHPFLRQADLSGLTYVLEMSVDPWNEESWVVLDTDLAVESIEVESPVLAQTTLAFESGVLPIGAHIRLTVDRAFPIGQDGSVTWDPALFAANGSIFAYDPREPSGWTFSWFDWSWDGAFPWVYSVANQWRWFETAHPNSIWMWEPGLGWLWTSSTVHPIFYRFSSDGWYWQDTSTSIPNRRFFQFSSASFVLESDF